MKKNLAYLLVASENIIYAAANVALSLNRYLKDLDYEILIYHTGLSDKNLQALTKIPHVKTECFSFPEGFSETMLSKKGLPENGRWKNKNSLLTAVHFEIFDLLHLYHTVIWLDVDILIQGDISSLKNFGPLALPKDLNWNSVWSVGDQFTKNIPGFVMSKESNLNAVIVVNDKLEHFERYTSECYSLALQYAPYLKNLDQAVFQLLFQKNNLEPREIPWNEFSCHADHDAASLAKIVHFGTSKKVWNDSLLFQCFPEWFRTHVEWLSLGGCDFDRSNLNSKSIYYSITRENSTAPAAFGIRYHTKALGQAIVARLLRYNLVRQILNFPIFPRVGDRQSIRLRDVLVPIYRKLLNN